MSPRSKRALVTRETGENRALQRDSIARHVTPITEHVAARALELHEEPIGSTFAATAVRDPWARRDSDSEARTSFTGAQAMTSTTTLSSARRLTSTESMHVVDKLGLLPGIYTISDPSLSLGLVDFVGFVLALLHSVSIS
jgi:hypothetical protein